MAKFDSAEMENNAARIAASMMAAAIRTAPKAKGIDAIKTMVLEGQDLEILARAMEKKAAKPDSFFIRDANNLRGNIAILWVDSGKINQGF